MVFSSAFFIYAFLPALMVLYYLVKDARWRRGVLLTFSLLFYTVGEPVYIFLMLGSALMNYVFALMIGKAQAAQQNQSARNAVVAAVVLNLALLGIFKYAGFAVESINAVTGLSIPVPAIRLPLGISFYTFQAMTYVIDVYRGYCQPQKKYDRVLLYITLFPQLVAGPIVRYIDVEEALEDRRVSAGQINTGVWRFVIGLSKKVILSNALDLACRNMFSVAGSTVLGNWLAILFYALHIYFDFSGYSDMAIGLGHMFGFSFPENFNYPYICRSISDFWRRWHITLSSWFRDYLFYPVLRSGTMTRMSRRLKKQGHKTASRAVPTIIALVIVWFSTGLWHGAAWNFVLWGLYYGFWLILEQFVTDKYMKKLPKPASAIIGHVGSALIILFGYAIFYHENNLFANLGHMLGIGTDGFSSVYAISMLKENGVLLIASLICVTPLSHILFSSLQRKMRSAWGVQQAYAVDRILKTALILMLLFICTARLAGDSYNPFIYFRF